MTKTIDESLDRIAGSNLETSAVEEERQINQEMQLSEAKDKMEKVMESFYIFLPHLKGQIDFCQQYGQILVGKYSKNLAGGYLSIEARGSKFKSLWGNSYTLNLHFKFKAQEFPIRQNDPLVTLGIPEAEGKEKNTKVTLHLKKSISYTNKLSSTIKKVRLPELVEIVATAYQESSNTGMEIFQLEVAENYGPLNYKMMLPYVFSAIPDLTVNAAHRLNELMNKRKEAVTANTEYIKELKAPDLEEAIELLNQKKP